MTEKNFTEKRRKLLLSITAASGAVMTGKSLPESWTRPVVDSVMLPAHAQTSATMVYSANGLSASLDNDDASLFARLMKVSVPEASAFAGSVYYYQTDACAQVAGENVDVEFQFILVDDAGIHGTFRYTALLPVSGDVVPANSENVCSDGQGEGFPVANMKVSELSNDQIKVDLGYLGVYTIPFAGSCVPFSTPQCRTACDVQLEQDIAVCEENYNTDIQDKCGGNETSVCADNAAEDYSSCVTAAINKRDACDIQ